jgi:serine/threonine protein kinase
VREARLLLSFTHPHLVRAFELLQAAAGQLPVLLLEPIVGPTLDQRLWHGGRLPLRDLILLGRQLCSVVGYLHDHRYLHLDIQCTTIVFDGDRARLVDLSSARRPGRITRGWGTSYQISPEQARGGKLTRPLTCGESGSLSTRPRLATVPFSALPRTECPAAFASCS